MWKPNKKLSHLVIAQCPVCRTILGNRNPNTIFMVHCGECRASFTWKPGEEKPTAQLDKHKPQRCGCNGCGR